MRSSGSTPNRSPRPPFPLFLLLVGEDHPRACTGRALLRRGIVRPLGESGRWPRGTLLLDPHAASPVSASDRSVAAHGLVAVDCSWNRLGERGGYPRTNEQLGHQRIRRRLPWLLAGNAQHYGRLGELNTAEALAGALYVLGSPEWAKRVLASAGRGESFLTLNHELLESYRRAATPEGVHAAEATFF